MQTRKRLLILGLLALGLLVIVALAWNVGWWKGDTNPDPDTAGTSSSPLTAERDAKNEVGLEGSRVTRVEEAVTLPSPVDFSKADRERDLHGVVVREDGSPVAGAELQVLHYPWRHDGLLTAHGLYFESREGPATHTAVDGTFSIRLRHGEHVNLRVSAKGLATTEYTLRLSGERARIVLKDPYTLIVKAKTPKGKPAAGLLLHIFRAGRGEISFRRIGTTNDDGICTFDDVPQLPTIHLDPRPAHEGWGNPSWIRISMEKSGTTTYELALPKGRTIRGRVMDSVSNKPIEGALVGMNWTLTPQTKTDADGHFELHGWMGIGVSEIHVLADGYGRAVAEVGQHETIDFELVPGHRFVGRVVDADGKPIAMAQVSAIGSTRIANNQITSMGSTVTDAAGRFVISSLRREMSHSLTVFARGHARHFADSVPPPVDGNEVDLEDITLGPSRSLVGTIMLADETPVVRASARLTHVIGEQRGHRYARTLERASDDLGRYRFDDIPPGNYRLSVTPQGESATKKDVVVKDDDEPTTVNVILETSREVRVRVIDDAGDPVNGARLSVMGPGPQDLMSASTDSDGLSVVRLKAGTVKIQVWLGNDAPYEGHRGVSVVDQSEVEIVLKRAVLTRGRILDPAGKPVAWAHISIERNGLEIGRTFSSEIGVFTYRTSIKERFDVVFLGKVGKSKAQLYMVPNQRAMAGKAEGVQPGAQDVVLQAKAIESGRSLTVRVLDPGGNTLPKIYVFLQPTLPGRTRVPMTGKNGEVTHDNLLAMPTQVRVSFMSTAAQPWRSPLPQRVVPNGQTLEVQLVTGTTIEGTVFEHEGTPLKSGSVQVFHNQRTIGSAWVNAEGQFVAVLDPAITEDVELRMYVHGKGRSRTATQKATPGTTGIELHLPRPK